MDGETDPGMSVRLRAARARLGWSREELAFHSGVSWSAITQAESGRRRNLRPLTLSRLCGALGVSMDYLVNGHPTRPMLTHQALLYENPGEFAEGAGEFLLEGVARSEAGLAVTDPKNLRRLKKRLGADAGKVEFVDSARGYTTPDVPVRMFGDFIDQKLAEGSVWVRIVGEPPWSGRSRAEVRMWTRYESLINLIFAGSPMSILCPYAAGHLTAGIMRDAHATHPVIVEGGESRESSGYRDPAEFVLGD